MSAPEVTVLMPAHNAGRYLEPAVSSILRQTLREFTLLVIDDGSTDGSIERLRTLRDGRIRVVRNERNLGLVATLNRGLDEATGRYIARMDADDLAHPNRLERQVAFLERRTDVGLCGTWFSRFGAQPRRIIRPPTEPAEVEAELFARSPLCHPSVMVRRDVLERFRLRYDAAYLHCEDYELWTRLAQVTRLANLPEVLLHYRVHPGQVSSAMSAEQEQGADRIRVRQLQRLDPNLTSQQQQHHLDVLARRGIVTPPALRQAEQWLLHLIGQNEARAAPVYPGSAFRALMQARWLQICVGYPGLMEAAAAFRQSPLGTGTVRFALARTRRLAGGIPKLMKMLR